MKKGLVALIAALAFAAPAFGQQFTVVNKCQPSFRVVNCVPEREVAQIVTTLRQPRGGHTHTCSAGHTWDHSANPTHTCNALVERNGRIEACGRTQYVQDRTPRMVTVTTSSVAMTASTPVVGVSATRPAVAYELPAGFTSGGCVNGNCPNVSFTRFR